LLELRPRAVWNAKPVKASNLPDCFRRFAKGSVDPDLVMVRLLRLVVDEGLAQVVEALEQTQAVGSNSVQVVEYYLNQEKSLPPLNISGPIGGTTQS
jgi:hypothetical protein